MEDFIAVIEGVIAGMEAWPPEAGSENAGFLRGLRYALQAAEDCRKEDADDR